jgi:hypothetical protein
MKELNKQWTFGIISTNVDMKNIFNSKLGAVIESIYALNIEESDYEIIIVGENSEKTDCTHKNIKYINFDESVKNKWITRKKNIIIEKALFDNIIIIHDYVIFDKNWYIGYQSFDTVWDVSMCKIVDINNVRWRDWILWWNAQAPYRIEHHDVLLAPNRLLYDDTRFVNTEMYINGTVIIGKRDYLRANKLDENLVWGQGEDCEWSARCRATWNYKMNKNSKLKLLKQHDNT